MTMTMTTMMPTTTTVSCDAASPILVEVIVWRGSRAGSSASTGGGDLHLFTCDAQPCTRRCTGTVGSHRGAVTIPALWTTVHVQRRSRPSRSGHQRIMHAGSGIHTATHVTDTDTQPRVQTAAERLTRCSDAVNQKSRPQRDRHSDAPFLALARSRRRAAAGPCSRWDGRHLVLLVHRRAALPH